MYGKKTLKANRLIWWKEAANEAFWYDHFKAQIDMHYQMLKTDRVPIVAELLQESLPKSGRIIEAGCGTGWIVHVLKQAGYNVEGVDYSEDLIKLVHQAYPELPVRAGNVLALDVPDGFYSAYISLGVVEHRLDGPKPFLEEAYRILQPGGKIAISVPNFGLLRRLKAGLGHYSEAIHESLDFYQYGYKASDFAHILEDSGFKLNTVNYYTFDRLLDEEISLYKHIRVYKRLRDFIDSLFSPFDGHMALFIATKS